MVLSEHEGFQIHELEGLGWEMIACDACRRTVNDFVKLEEYQLIQEGLNFLVHLNPHKFNSPVATACVIIRFQDREFFTCHEECESHAEPEVRQKRRKRSLLFDANDATRKFWKPADSLVDFCNEPSKQKSVSTWNKLVHKSLDDLILFSLIGMTDDENPRPDIDENANMWIFDQLQNCLVDLVDWCLLTRTFHQGLTKAANLCVDGASPSPEFVFRCIVSRMCTCEYCLNVQLLLPEECFAAVMTHGLTDGDSVRVCASMIKEGLPVSRDLVHSVKACGTVRSCKAQRTF